MKTFRKRKGILIAIDPGHQAPDVDMSAKEPNAPGSNVMKQRLPEEQAEDIPA